MDGNKLQNNYKMDGKLITEINHRNSDNNPWQNLQENLMRIKTSCKSTKAVGWRHRGGREQGTGVHMSRQRAGEEGWKIITNKDGKLMEIKYQRNLYYEIIRLLVQIRQVEKDGK